MKDAYVAATHHYLDSGMDPAALVAALTRVMAARGHEQLLRTVLRAVLREREASRSVRTVVRVNNGKGYDALSAEIQAVLTELEASDDPTIIEDASLIGGFQVEANHTRVDASQKTQLLSLYRNITHPTTS